MRYLLAIREMLIEHIHGASPHVTVMKLTLLPLGTSEQVSRADTQLRLRHMVVQIHHVGDSHGPQRGISLLWPMDCSMEHHHMGQQHDGLYGMLSSSVVVMSACASKTDDLSELMKLVCEPTGGECRPII